MADKAYVMTFYFLCLVLQNHRFNKKKCLINICLKGRNFILPFHLSKIWSNSMKDKHVKINTLTDLTFDSESVFKSQLSYLWTSYSLTSNLSLDSSRDSICHDDNLCYVYSKISPLCVHQEELHWRKALSVLWPVIPHGLHSAYNKRNLSYWQRCWYRFVPWQAQHDSQMFNLASQLHAHRETF